MNVHDRVKVFFAHLQKRAIPGDARIGHHDIDLAKGINTGTDNTAGTVPVTYITGISDCLATQRRDLTDAMTLTGKSGVSMTMATTEPGLQVYDGRNGIRPGHAAYEGLAFEAQFWPDAPNNPKFPDITLPAATMWEQVTEWRFRPA